MTRRPLLAALTFIGSHLCSGRAQTTEMESRYQAGQAAIAAGDLSRARSIFEQLSRANPSVAEVHATLGALLFQQGDFTAALAELTRAKQVKPTLPKLDGLIAMSQSELGQYRTALPGLQQVFRTAEDRAVKRMSGLELERAYTALRQPGEAVRVALELQRLFPDDAEVLYRNERIFGNYAYVTVQKLAEVAPDSVWTHQARAEAEESQGHHDTAIAEYRKVLEMDANHRGVHYRIGRCLRERARDSHRSEDLTAAMQEFEAEWKIDPESANAAFEIGELHRLSGELEPAKQFFATALRLYPEFPEANLGLGTVLSSMNQPEAALPYLKKAVAEDPSDESSWYRLAQAERALGHASEQQAALKEFQRLHNETAAQPTRPSESSRQEIPSSLQP